MSLAGSTIGDPFITNVFSRCGPSSDFLFILALARKRSAFEPVLEGWILLSKKPQELRLIPEEIDLNSRKAAEAANKGHLRRGNEIRAGGSVEAHCICLIDIPQSQCQEFGVWFDITRNEVGVYKPVRTPF